MLDPLTMLFWLIVSHCVCDYPLQGDFLAKGKNCKAPIPGVPWQVCLFAHSAIHAGGVMLVTQSITLAMVEFFIHCSIDDAKCRGKFGFTTDQALHIACKVLYAAMIYWIGAHP